MTFTVPLQAEQAEIRFRIDPALACSGILTFVTDACGFFFILALATQFLKQIAG